jgi:hypothetical protein
MSQLERENILAARYEARQVIADRRKARRGTRKVCELFDVATMMMVCNALQIF